MFSSYFDTVRNRSTFNQKAVGAKVLRELRKLTKGNENKTTPHAVSDWGREHLFALRVLCNRPTTNLLVLEPHFPSDQLLDAHLTDLINGPRHAFSKLVDLSEPQIVRSYEPDSLGSVWAALGALLRPRPEDNQTSGQGQKLRPNPQQSQHDPNLVRSDRIQIGSSSPLGDRPSSSSSAGSIGYTENPKAPVVEDLSVHLAGCFIRYVLNYGQDLAAARIAEFRDDRASVSVDFLAEPSWGITTIDDGGVRMFRRGRDAEEVALLEAKRRFQVIEDGKPTVSDGLLAQMVGQALTLLVDDSESRRTVSPNSVITIQATRHFIRFFHFEASAQYRASFVSESLSPTVDSDPCLFVESTSEWFDIKERNGRKMIVRHLLALVEWAREAAAHHERESGGENDWEGDGMDMEMEDE